MLRFTKFRAAARHDPDAARSAIDLPVAGAIVPQSGFSLSGWALRGDHRIERVIARHRGMDVGATPVPYVRDDVEPGRRCGYRMFVEPHRDQGPGPYDVQVFVRFDDGEFDAGTVRCTLSEFDERTMPYGGIAGSWAEDVWHRDNIYGNGPPTRECSAELLRLLSSYVDAGTTVLDVGCGAAPYARPLLDAGRRWSGCEVRPDLVAESVAAGLDVTLVTAPGLPFPDRSFDFVMCIEVLEHIEDFEFFTREIARVARRAACFSVPNVRAIPRYAPVGLIPWHLLEATHINFFTVANLRALLRRHFADADAFEYGALPIPAIDGTPVNNHVFAVATVGTNS